MQPCIRVNWDPGLHWRGRGQGREEGAGGPGHAQRKRKARRQLGAAIAMKADLGHVTQGNGELLSRPGASIQRCTRLGPALGSHIHGLQNSKDIIFSPPQ